VQIYYELAQVIIILSGRL